MQDLNRVDLAELRSWLDWLRHNSAGPQRTSTRETFRAGFLAGRRPGPDRGTIDDLAQFNSLARKLAAARADVSRLLAALRRWTDCDGGGGEHLHGCGSTDGDPCDCGLEEARDLIAEHRAGGGGGQGGDPLAP